MRYVVRVGPYTATPLVVDAPGLAQRLTAAMTAANLTLRPLADLSKVDKETISNWQRGIVTNVHIAKVRQVAVALGTTAEDLLDLPVPAQQTQPPPARLLPDLDRVQGLVEELAGVIADARKGAGG
jgi:transcriptional regulator with XRE-family HTH domain